MELVEVVLFLFVRGEFYATIFNLDKLDPSLLIGSVPCYPLLWYFGLFVISLGNASQVFLRLAAIF